MKLPVDLQGIRAMVVDDNLSTRRVFQKFLEKLTLEVTSVGSGSEALRELERAARQGGEKPYELVLVDWKMPGMDGVETVIRIKESCRVAGEKAPAILFVTGFGRLGATREAEQHVDVLLLKPVTYSAMFRAIMEAFGRDITEKSRMIKPADVDIKGLDQIRGARILLVDDQEINRQVAGEILEDAGLVVSTANNGSEAVEMIFALGSSGREQKPFDAILMDIQMPVMDGYEATKQIRKLEQDPLSPISHLQSSLPIIAMTGHAMGGDREKSLASGLNDHVTKPIDPDFLFLTLVKWIKPGEREVPKGTKGQKETEKRTVEGDLPHIPGIDVASALARVGGKKKVFENTLRKFSADFSDSPSRIGSAIEDNDMELAKHLVHALKGVSGNIGANGLFEIAQDFEKSIIEGQIDGLGGLLSRLSSSLEQVLDSIDSVAWAGDESEGSGPAVAGEAGLVNLKEITSRIKDLRAFLEDDDTRAMDCLSELKEYLGGYGRGREELSKLTDLISNYEFEAALSLLVEIEKELGIGSL